MQTSKSDPKSSRKAGGTAESGLARFGLTLANWSERWFPDPLVFALAGVVIVFLFGLASISPQASLRLRAARVSGV